MADSKEVANSKRSDADEMSLTVRHGEMVSALVYDGMVWYHDHTIIQEWYQYHSIIFSAGARFPPND